MAKIYTKGGDKGETGLFGGERVRKSSLRIEAYGEVDEVNALLGLARALKPAQGLDQVLSKIQNDLFDLGALLATRQKERLKGKIFIRKEDISYLEQTIDHYDAELPPLKNFILPGGSPLASLLHVARTVARRAERKIVRLADEEAVEPEVIIYMNRLSDLLFVLARGVNLQGGIADLPWRQKS